MIITLGLDNYNHLIHQEILCSCFKQISRVIIFMLIPITDHHEHRIIDRQLTLESGKLMDTDMISCLWWSHCANTFRFHCRVPMGYTDTSTQI